MNVLLLYWGRTGGGARYSYEIAKALARSDEVNLFLSLSRQSAFFESFSKLGLPCIHVDTYETFGGMLWGLGRIPKYRHMIFNFIKENDIDVVYSPMTHIWNWPIVYKIANTGARYVLTMHDAVTHKGDLELIKNILLRGEVKATKRCIALSETVKSKIHDLYGYANEKIDVVPHGAFDYGDFSARTFPKNRRIRILFYGRILDYKGLGLLLDSLIMLSKNNRSIKWELDISGAGDITKYKNQISQLDDLGCLVIIKNQWIEECEIEAIYRRADICALPYIEASQSGVAAIAFASGLPIVATPQPGLVEQLQHGGGIVSKETSVASYAMSLLKLAENPEQYEELSKECLHIAKHVLSWQAIGEGVINALKNKQ